MNIVIWLEDYLLNWSYTFVIISYAKIYKIVLLLIIYKLKN